LAACHRFVWKEATCLLGIEGNNEVHPPSGAKDDGTLIPRSNEKKKGNG
jgi:hypothetical protein